MRVPALPPECGADDKIAALESELMLLRPYASAEGLRKLRARVREIESAMRRLTGLPLEDGT